MKRNYSLCLNMIVKNESEIILETLKNLNEKINFDYWVISDTGSTDKTKEIIVNYFKEKKISGELVEHEWKNFGYNRTKALEAAYNKTDYLLIHDADDFFEGDFILPNNLNCDSYHIKIKTGVIFTRKLIVNNRKKWEFLGVLHEFIRLKPNDGHDKNKENVGYIEGNYYVNARTIGNRNKDPEKYINDAKILEKGIIEENENIFLKNRYKFYCAQSYHNAKQFDKSIYWYKEVLSSNNWLQEKYYSCLIIGDIYKIKGDMQQATKYWCNACKYDNNRIENIVKLCEYYCQSGHHILCNLLFNKYKTKSRGFPTNIHEKLFLQKEKYNYNLDYFNSISAYYLNDTNDIISGYESIKILLKNWSVINRQLLLKTIDNLIFYLQHVKTDKKNEILQLFYNITNFIFHFSNQKIKSQENEHIECSEKQKNLLKQILSFLDMNNDKKIKEISQKLCL